MNRFRYDIRLSEIDRRAVEAEKAIRAAERRALRDWIFVVMIVAIVVVFALVMWGPK